MPLYDYDCANCGRRFEVLHGVDAPPPTACPLCGGGPVKKTITAPAVHYKGSGWAKKERRATAAPGKSAGSSERGDSDHAASTSDGSGSKVDTNGSGGSGSSARLRRLGRLGQGGERRRGRQGRRCRQEEAQRAVERRRLDLGRLTMASAADWITLAEAQAILADANVHFSAATIGGWARAGRLQSIKLGGRRYVRRGQVRALVARPDGSRPRRCSRRSSRTCGTDRQTMDPAAILDRILQRPLVAEVRAVLDTYGRAPGGLLANGLAFATLFAAFPIALLVLGVAGLFVGGPEAQAALADSLKALFPPLADFVDQALNTLTSGATALSIIGLIGVDLGRQPALRDARRGLQPHLRPRPRARVRGSHDPGVPVGGAA